MFLHPVSICLSTSIMYFTDITKMCGWNSGPYKAIHILSINLTTIIFDKAFLSCFPQHLFDSLSISCFNEKVMLKFGWNRLEPRIDVLNFGTRHRGLMREIWGIKPVTSWVNLYVLLHSLRQVLSWRSLDLLRSKHCGRRKWSFQLQCIQICLFFIALRHLMKVYHFKLPRYKKKITIS